MTMERLALLWTLLPCLCQASYVLELHANSDAECFTIHTPHDERGVFSFDYDIFEKEDSMATVHIWLEDTVRRHRAWEAQPDKYEDKFGMTVDPSSRYSLCFQPEKNDLDDSAVIDVGFNIRVHPLPRSLESGEEGPDAQRAMQLTESTLTIEDDWESMLDHFDYLRQRESVHDILSSEIMGRVLRWTLIESGLVVTMATAQVMYWKKFFEQRRYL